MSEKSSMVAVSPAFEDATEEHFKKHWKPLHEFVEKVEDKLGKKLVIAEQKFSAEDGVSSLIIKAPASDRGDQLCRIHRDAEGCFDVLTHYVNKAGMFTATYERLEGKDGLVENVLNSTVYGVLNDAEHLSYNTEPDIPPTMWDKMKSFGLTHKVK